MPQGIVDPSAENCTAVAQLGRSGEQYYLQCVAEMAGPLVDREPIGRSEQRSLRAPGARVRAAIIEESILKALGWIILVIFLIGLLVVLGVFKAIF